MKLLGRKILFILFVLTGLYGNDYGINISSSEKSIYPNQPFTLNVDFNYKVDSKIDGIKIYNPSFKNLKILNKTKLKTFVENGRIYGSFKYLFQTTTNKDTKIKPFVLEISQKKKIKVDSNSLIIKSILLPKDVEFVGDCNISTKLRKVKDTLTYFDIVIEGVSYTKLPYSRYDLKIPNVDIFEDKLEIDCKEKSYKFYCKKHVSYSLIAKQDYIIPSIEVKYIDIKTNKLVIKKTQEGKVDIQTVLDTSQDAFKEEDPQPKLDNLKDDASMFTKSRLFYLYLFLGFLVVLGSIFIAILAYKKSIRDAKEKIILKIEDVKSNENLYSLLLPYYGLDATLDIMILDIKNKTRALEQNKKDLISLITQKQIYSLFRTKQYGETNKVKTLILEDKIKIYTESTKYKVNKEKLIDINEEKNTIKHTPKVKKDNKAFNFEVLILYLMVFLQSLSILSIVPLLIILFNLILSYYSEYILPVIQYLVVFTNIVSSEEEATRFVNEIVRIVLVTQLWMNLKINYLNFFGQIGIVGIILFPIVTLWINFKNNFTMKNMAFILKIVLGISGVFSVYMLYLLGATYSYDYDGWLSFFVVMAFVFVYIELFDKQCVVVQATNTDLLNAKENINAAQKKQLKYINYLFLPLVGVLYIVLYFTIADWSGSAIVFFAITPFLFISFIYEFMQRYFIYEMPLRYIFTYKEFKEVLPSIIFLFYIYLHINFIKI